MRLGLAAAALASCAALAAPAAAQSWPDKPVRIIIPFVAGGPSDAIARIVVDKLYDRWKQSIVIETRPGAGTNLGTGAVARSTPDGSTLLLTSTAVAVNKTLFKNPGYDALKDLVAIVNVAHSPNLIIATRALKVSTLQDALEQARSGKLSYGSPGAGTTPHLTMEYLFKVLAKVDVAHVAFKGGGDLVTAALSAAVPLGCGAVPTVFAIVEAGHVRGLGVTSRTRLSALPEVPTLAESGFKDFEDYTWFGFFAPGGTPSAIVSRINADVGSTLTLPDVREKLGKIGLEIVGGPADEFARYVAAEVAKWASVVKAIGTPQL